MKRVVLQLLVGVLLVGMTGFAADLGSPVVVNGIILDAWEFDREIRQLIPYSSFHRNLDEERRAELERKAYDTLIMKELKRQWAVQEELPIDTSLVDQEMAEIRDRFDDSESFSAALAEQGITEVELRHAITRDVTAKAVDSQILDAVPPPTTAEVEAFFAEHREDYVAPESRHVIHVLIPVAPSAPATAWEQAKTEAESLAAAARKDKIDLAIEANRRRSNLAPNLRDQTGDLGNVHHGSLKPAVNEPVFSADVGEIVGPIRTLYGFSVLEVVSNHLPEQLELDQVRNAVEDRMHRERRETALNAFKADLLASATIQQWQ